MLFKCCTQYANKFGKLSSGHRTGKGQFASNLKERQYQECSNYRTIARISHTSKVLLKILQARLQQYVNRELPDVQAGFRKGRGTRDQDANILWIIESKRAPHTHPQSSSTGSSSVDSSVLPSVRASVKTGPLRREGSTGLPTGLQSAERHPGLPEKPDSINARRRSESCSHGAPDMCVLICQECLWGPPRVPSGVAGPSGCDPTSCTQPHPHCPCLTDCLALRF